MGGIFLFGDYNLQNQERMLSLNFRSPKKGPQFTKQLGCIQGFELVRKGFERGKSRHHSSDSGGRNLKRLWGRGVHQSRADGVIKGESLDGLTQGRLSSPRTIISSDRGLGT